MKKALFMPVILAVLVNAGCDSSTEPGPRASLRFFNGTTGMTGSGGFTANGQFATGSALAFGQSTCSAVDAGLTSFGFGAANTAGTGLGGNALATLSNQSIIDGGNLTLVSTGSASNPRLFLLDNSFSGSLGANQAAVRFVNLAPGTGTTANTFVVYIGALAAGVAPYAIDIPVGAPTTFSAATSGSHEFTVLGAGHVVVVSGSAATFNLDAGTVNTLAIVPNAASDGFQLINLPRCS